MILHHVLDEWFGLFFCDSWVVSFWSPSWNMNALVPRLPSFIGRTKFFLEDNAEAPQHWRKNCRSDFFEATIRQWRHTVQRPNMRHAAGRKRSFACDSVNQHQEWPSGSQIARVRFSRLRAA
jgi:hypothetical protein